MSAVPPYVKLCNILILDGATGLHFLFFTSCQGNVILLNANNNDCLNFFFYSHLYYETLVKVKGTPMCLKIFYKGFDLHWSNLVSVSACC